MIPGGLNMACFTPSVPQDYIASWTQIDGTTLVDTTGNFNGIIYNNPVISNGVITFDGVANYIKIPAFNPNSKIVTISYRATINTIATAIMFEMSTNSNNNSNTFGTWRNGLASNDIVVVRRNVTPRQQVFSWVNTKTHFIVEINNANNTTKCIVSTGELISTNTVVGAAVNANFAQYDLYIGARAGTTLFYKGSLYPNTRIYNRSLTIEEHLQLINE